MAKRLLATARRPAAKRFYASLVRPGDLVFDVGANVGERTTVFRALGARVVAIEPQRHCLDRLKDAFGDDPLVSIVSVGLAATAGTMELSICDAAPTISTMSAAWREEGRFSGSYEWTRTETVPVTTLDALVDEYGVPAFCKIDVEGFELNVLEGLSRPIPSVSFEFAREFMDQAVACIRRIESLGGFTFNVSLGESMRFLLAQNVPADELLAILDSRPDPLLWGDVYAVHSSSRSG
ncbi:MAG TPA: FkbM family methyltransferase [Jiangellales bacterium]|nr:FkbM family methyltransferase [Jiangellales bacterium]